MNKTILLFASLFLFLSSIAQPGSEWKEASKESQQYRKKREAMTEPPFGLQKVKRLIAHAQHDEEDNEFLDKKTYESLSLREKFTYHMIHGESYSQICDAYPPIQDEEKKIFGQLPELFNEQAWSERQVKFFTSNKDTVLALMKLCIEKNKKVGLNFKHAIVDMNAKEMIPYLIELYNIERKDHDILTVLMLLMKNNNYGPFITSSSNKKLYGNDADYYGAYLNLNKANQDLIIQRAKDFYNGLPR